MKKERTEWPDRIYDKAVAQAMYRLEYARRYVAGGPVPVPDQQEAEDSMDACRLTVQALLERRIMRPVPKEVAAAAEALKEIERTDKVPKRRRRRRKAKRATNGRRRRSKEGAEAPKAEDETVAETPVTE